MITTRGREVVEGWNRFWFTPQSTAPLALFRVAFGLTSFVWTITLAPDLSAFFGPAGVAPSAPELSEGSWSLLTLSPGMPVVVALWAATLVASVAVTIGAQTRLAAVVLFVGILSFERRNGLVFNGGDGLIRNLAFFLILSPAGEALSLDRWRVSRDNFWEFPERSNWALRLIQIQLSVVYLSTVWSKLQGQWWPNGLAVGYAVRIGDIQRLPTPSFITDSQVLTELLTFGTLALELSLGVLVWNRVARPWVMTLGVAFHMLIELTMMVGYFTAAMLCAYLAFLSPAGATAVVTWARGWLGSAGRRDRPDGGPPPVLRVRTRGHGRRVDTE